MNRALAILLYLALTSATAGAVWPNPNVSKAGKIAAASNNIPVAFDTTAGSLILSAVGGKRYSHLKCENETATRIAIATAEGVTAPSSTATTIIYIPANNFRILDEFTVLDKVYVQSDGSAISSGTVECEVW